MKSVGLTGIWNIQKLQWNEPNINTVVVTQMDQISWCNSNVVSVTHLLVLYLTFVDNWNLEFKLWSMPYKMENANVILKSLVSSFQSSLVILMNNCRVWSVGCSVDPVGFWPRQRPSATAYVSSTVPSQGVYWNLHLPGMMCHCHICYE